MIFGKKILSRVKETLLLAQTKNRSKIFGAVNFFYSAEYLLRR